MHIPDTIQNREDYQQCIRFHGHTCMGVTIGYLAAKLALELLKASPSIDEELIVIVENDACCCDAVQVLTGCTFGKGNFFFKDYGKMAFTFGNRETGEAIRLLLNQDAFEAPEDELQLLEKIRNAKASPAEIKQYEKLYETRGEEQFARGPESFFKVEKINLQLPPKATLAPSRQCSICQEMVMQTKLIDVAGQKVCRQCNE